MSDKALNEGVATESVKGYEESKAESEEPMESQGMDPLQSADLKDSLEGQTELYLGREESSCSSSKSDAGEVGAEGSSSEESTASHWQPGDVVW